jgi:hypothetical protein
MKKDLGLFIKLNTYNQLSTLKITSNRRRGPPSDATKRKERKFSTMDRRNTFMEWIHLDLEPTPNN